MSRPFLILLVFIFMSSLSCKNSVNSNNDNDTDEIPVWQRVNNGLTVPNILCLAIDPFNAEQLYAGTLNGIFKSTDAGDSWENVTHALPSTYIYTIVTHPLYEDHLLIGTKSGGVYLSRDAGDSWQRIWNISIKKQIHSLALHDSLIFAGTSNGIYKSMDFGHKWHFCNQWGKTLAIIINPDDPDVIYESANFYGNFISKDGGKLWKAINLGILDGAEWVDSAERFIFHPEEPGHLFMCSSVGLIYRTLHQGELWVRAANPPGLTVKYVSIDFAGNVLYAASQNHGVFASSDYGVSWENVGEIVSGVKSRVIRSMVSGENNYIYVGTLENGVYRYVEKR
ncbi:hypothetical protein GF407_05885 [candidate division KSB1 bacterium]|nr:hypothetical protein [candidate division KSB1 bacterium]